MHELRRMLGVLHSEDRSERTAPQPTLRDLGTLAERMRQVGMSIDLTTVGPLDEVSAGVALTIHRIAQEALTNVIKHAGGAQVGIRLHYGDDELSLEVTNDGPQVSHTGGRGRGLAGMRERTELLNGRLEAGPRSEGGFRVHARFPVHMSSGS